MKKVFISYHHAEPDQALAKKIVSAVKDRGHIPFIDVDIEIGERWAQRIEKEIRESSVFVVLISETSIYRDMVRSEVEIAYELYKADEADSEKDPKSRFRILPIRVGFEGDLPYDLKGYLGAFQYVLWRTAEDTEDIAKRIAGAIDGDSLRETRTLSGDHAVAQCRPQPVADILLETGGMLRDSPFYIVRQMEDEIFQNVNADGTTTIIHGSRQMGKSSLLARIHGQTTKQVIYLGGRSKFCVNRK